MTAPQANRETLRRGGYDDAIHPPHYPLTILYKSIANLEQSHLPVTTFRYDDDIHRRGELSSRKQTHGRYDERDGSLFAPT